MPQIIGTITRAAPRTIERRDGSGSFPLYEVWIDGQGPFVARKDVYNQAERLLNQHVDAITRDEERNGFLNHYLDFVGPTGQTQQQAPPQQQPGYQPQPQTAEQVMRQPEEEKTTSIHRQTATKVAALISKSQSEFWFNVEDLVIFYATGHHPSRRHALSNEPFHGETNSPNPVPHQNAAAYRQYREEPGNQYVPTGAYADPGPSDRPPPTDDDIPF